jgi:hypothetical protein
MSGTVVACSTAMTAEQRYYSIAGCLAIPAVLVPLIQLQVFHIFDYQAFFLFGTVGLLFGVPGILKGELRGRICGAIALLIWVGLAMVSLSKSTVY